MARRRLNLDEVLDAVYDSDFGLSVDAHPLEREELSGLESGKEESGQALISRETPRHGGDD